MTPFAMPHDLNKNLWPHQKKAIEFAVQYLREPKKAPVALVRMPTGTGKTGVIAVLSIAIPPSAWTLILTPWANLCDQMILDLRQRFWAKARWRPGTIPKIERLYPSNIEKLLQRDSPQLVLVATFATLVTIFKFRCKSYDQLATKLSQVFVDEGHYEPAVEWGQAVKHLKTPTVLLTATPYRNDLKLFRVAKNDVWHYTHKAAEADRMIRKAEFLTLDADEPSDRELGLWCDEFAKFWKGHTKKTLHPTPRAIVCCAAMTTVKLVTKQLRQLGIDALGIHERFGKLKDKWFRKQAPLEEVPFDVWVHQNKLTEGLDDQRFCVLAVLNRIRNDRKLIQQIGRILRRTDDKKTGQAMVLYSRGLSVEQSWQNYRQFEIQPDSVDPERYVQILNSVLNSQPEMEYFGGRFRHRFRPESADLQHQLLVPPSSVVRRVTKTFNFEQFVEVVSDFLLLEDRILLGPSQEPLTGPSESRLWVYATFGNSPLLIEHSQYEIRLGAMAGIQHDDLLFLADTEGLYPTEYLAEHTRKLSPGELARIFDRKMVPKEVSIRNPWPPGPCIRRSTVHADNLAGTPGRLTDSVFVCAGVRAKSPPKVVGSHPRRQYVGFQRGRIAEQIHTSERLTFSLPQFVSWTNELGGLIHAKNRIPPEFFHRYLSPLEPPASVQPRFVVFNFLDEELELENDARQAIELTESIIEVGTAESDGKGPIRFPITVQYRLANGTQEHSIDAMLLYDATAARFKVRGEELNSTLLVLDQGTSEATGLSNFLNNSDEAFTVALAQPDIFYTSQSFYGIDYTYAEARLSSIITPVAALKEVNSEKGKKGKRKKEWDASSVFALIASPKSNFIKKHFGNIQFLFCDDLQKEIADFVCADFSRRKIAFIHAKCGKGRKVSASALHEAVAQALKNLGVFSRAGAKPAHLNRWTRSSKWPGTSIKRWGIGSDKLPIQGELWKRIRTEILEHPDATREVWLVAGDTLDKTAFVEQLQNPESRDAVAGQLVHLLGSLQASCTEINVKLKIFCH
jgi:superfamily II DNA or RNA helicase